MDVDSAESDLACYGQRELGREGSDSKNEIVKDLPNACSDSESEAKLKSIGDNECGVNGKKMPRQLPPVFLRSRADLLAVLALRDGDAEHHSAAGCSLFSAVLPDIAQCWQLSLTL